MQNRFNIRSKKFLCWFVFITIIVLALLSFLYISLNDSDLGFTENRQKGVDLINIREYIVYTSRDQKQNILESLPVGCSNAGIIGDAISKISGNDRDKYTLGISADKRQFVLRTKIDDGEYLADISKNIEELDGNVFGCDCNDPYYCFKTDLFSQLENEQ